MEQEQVKEGSKYKVASILTHTETSGWLTPSKKALANCVVYVERFHESVKNAVSVSVNKNQPGRYIHVKDLKMLNKSKKHRKACLFDENNLDIGEQ